MSSGDHKSEKRERRFAPSVMALLVTTLAWSPQAVAETVLTNRELSNVVRTAVDDYFQRTIKRKFVESMCLFDPQVKDSMRCSSSSVDRYSRVDRSRLKNRLQSKVRTYCREAGGKNCILFMQNGEFRIDGLSSKQWKRLASVLGNIPYYDAEAKPLPDGVDVGSAFRKKFSRASSYFTDISRKRKFKNYHFALCTNSAGMSAWSSGQGTGASIADIRQTCVLKCAALSELYSVAGDCYVVFEDGEFASAAAAKTLTK